jgi:ZIP family zinc transporter
MKYVLYSFIAGLFTWLMTAIGSLAIFSVKPTNKKIMSCLMGFGGGVMIAASFFSLIMPSIEYCNILDFNILVLCIIGFLIGTLMIVIIDYYISKKDITNDQYNKSNILLVLAVVIHNIPEGLAIGVTFGSLAIGIDNVTLSGALLLTLGIGLQNLPEGAAISMPLAATRMNKFKAYLVGAISAIVEPIAAILGTLLVLSMRLFLPLMLLIAAAIMIFVVVDEIVPMANSYNKRLTSIGFIIGFIIMMILDLAFK